MPKRIVHRPKKRRRKTFIREWRKYRGLTQDQLGDRLETSGGSISRIESGDQPYTQDTLEALAEALQTDVASLLMRDPTNADAIWSIWDTAKTGERQKIEEYANFVVGKTGTDN